MFVWKSICQSVKKKKNHFILLINDTKSNTLLKISSFWYPNLSFKSNLILFVVDYHSTKSRWATVHKSDILDVRFYFFKKAFPLMLYILSLKNKLQLLFQAKNFLYVVGLLLN